MLVVPALRTSNQSSMLAGLNDLPHNKLNIALWEGNITNIGLRNKESYLLTVSGI